jgi:predicted ATPase
VFGGKTTAIDRLARLGYPVVPEAARAYIDSRLAAGLTLAQIKANPLSFERHILMEKVC